jgi:alpha-mannosidase
VHQNQKLVEARIRRVLDERITPAVHSARQPVSIAAWKVPDEPVPVAEALVADYTPFTLGTAWGRAWSTWWFELRGAIPRDWNGRTVELLIDPGFLGDWPGNQAEGLVYTPQGVPVKGIHPRNGYVRLAEAATGGEPVHFFVEAAANPDILVNEFVATLYGDKATSPEAPIYHFRVAELAVFEPDVWDLRFDIEVLFQLMLELPETEPRRAEILRALQHSLDTLTLDDIVGTATAARAELAEVLSRPANASAHRLSAIGHAHIDSAWLWPIRETKRKTARSFSNVLTLMQQYPEFRFAASQAQQYVWLQENYPEVWERMRAAITAGSWIPVGSMWVEADGNLPGGEAMARQLVYGMRFFAEALNVRTRGVWLPDSFGYSAAFPQLAKAAGLEWFLSQKLSWNQTNSFPHHTFWWEGIDGTRVFTHFPPVDTYNSTLEAEELHHAVANFRENGGATRSLVPFGYGDGGGGPTREMMERYRRARNLEGSPRLEIETPDSFFEKALAEYSDAPVWVGELYLELHRGTFTSHAREKRGNRASEARLREAELWSTAATLRTGAEYPYDRIEQLWKRALLQQFHDILPGSSIAWVHRENEEAYRTNLAELEMLIAEATSALGVTAGVLNAAGHARRALVEDENGVPSGLVEVPGSGLAPVHFVSPTHPVVGSTRLLDNGLLRVRLDDSGLIDSIVDVRVDRELVPPGRRANLLQLHEDLPNAWDAWDIDGHYRNSMRDLDWVESIDLVESSPLRCTVRIVRAFGRSRAVQYVSLVADDARVHLRTDVDWQEEEKLLKVSFPLVVHAQHHSAEIQFGHVRRATHVNTSWDDARFEVAAHRWVHVEEPGYGVGLSNNGSYGHDITRTVGDSGEVQTELRISLVRAARSPDPAQDVGLHRFDHALVPGADIETIVRAGYEQHLPVRQVPGAVTDATSDATSWSLLEIEGEGIHLESVMMAADRSGDVIARLYEARGSRGSARLRPGFEMVGYEQVDLLERPLGPDARRVPRFEATEAGLELALWPFQIVTVRLVR